MAGTRRLNSASTAINQYSILSGENSGSLRATVLMVAAIKGTGINDHEISSESRRTLYHVGVTNVGKL